MPLKQSSISGSPSLLHYEVGTLSMSVTIRPSAPYYILSSIMSQHLDSLGWFLALSWICHSGDVTTATCLSLKPGVSTAHSIFIFYIFHDASLFLEPQGTFPSSELLQCPVQMRRYKEKLVGGPVSWTVMTRGGGGKHPHRLAVKAANLSEGPALETDPHRCCLLLYLQTFTWHLEHSRFSVSFNL